MEKEFYNILERVSSLYIKYGLKSITMDDVARELGISKKTLYNYVTDKKDLIEKSLLHTFEKQRVFLEQVKAKGLNAIQELFEVYKYIDQTIKECNPTMNYDLNKYYPELAEYIRNNKREQMYKSLKENMKKGINEGLFRKNINIEIIARLHIFRMESLMGQPIFDDLNLPYN